MSYDPEFKQRARYINFYEIVTKKEGIDALFLLSKE